MILFPNAKINIGLNILRKRGDGYHDLETIFYPIGLKDGLEFIENNKNKIVFSTSGLPLDVTIDDNIIVKAYRLLSADYPLPGLDIHLHKVIPFGAGLGGGSSDAAFLLMGLNEFFHLGLSLAQLKGYAVKLGADCPFFVDNKPAFASGIGEQLQLIDFSLKGHTLILVKPPYCVGTSEAYSNVTPHIPDDSLLNLFMRPLDHWQDAIVNDFETSVFGRYPQIAEIKKRLIAQGAGYAAMSGSGSSVFGLFKEESQLSKSDFDCNCFFWKETLKA